MTGTGQQGWEGPKTDHLVCPRCHSADIDVYRDGDATRACRECDKVWLPAEDPPEAGGPYVVGEAPF